MDYPPLGFHFLVEFDLPELATEFRFREVSGLSRELEEETHAEGGENRFSHRLPGRARYGDLVLKRGLLVDSALKEWCDDAILDLEIRPANLLVSLLNEKHEPLQSYSVVSAWPKKWSLSDFNAESSEVVIESLELAYQYFRIV